MPRTRFLQASLIVLSALALFVAHPAHAQLSFRYDTFDVPNEDLSAGALAEGISASGNIAGTFVGTDTLEHGYVRNTNGSFITIDYRDANGQIANNTRVWTGGINNAGYVIGDAYDAKFNYLTDFIYNSNNKQFIMPTINLPGTNTPAAITGLQNVNEAGIVAIQYSSIFDGPYHNASYNINTGTFTYYDDIPGYNNDMQSVGPNGELVIRLDSPNGDGSHGLVIRNGVQIHVDYPGAYGTSANAINADGLISGIYRDKTQKPYAFIYDSNLSRYYANDNARYYQIAYPDPGATTTRLFHGNNDTQFVGYYIDAVGVYHNLVVTAVPEPDSIALLVGLSVAGAGFLRRRTRKVRSC